MGKFEQWTRVLCLVVFQRTLGFNVTIISLLPYSVDVGVNLRWTGPALLAAVTDTNLLLGPRYHAIPKLIFDETHQNCTRAREEVPGMLAEFYYQQQLEGSCIALIGANCIDMNSVADLAREWDVMAFAMGPVSEEVIKNDVAFLMGGSSLGMAAATLSVMDAYSWKHAAVLLEENSFTNAYSQYAKSLVRARRKKRATAITIISIQQTTEAILVKTLKAAQIQSRVIIISAPAATALKILRVASELNMTDGNYAYINFQTTLQEPYGKLSLFSDPCPKDIPAIQSLVFMTSRQNEADARRSVSLNQRLRKMSQNLYNSTFDASLEPLDSIVVRATYDAVDFFMRQIVHFNGDDITCSGKVMASKVTNRTFSLRTGKTFINEDGVREMDSVVYRFSSSKQSMQSVAFYDSSSRILLWDSNVTADWPNGITPVDIPRCGFDGLSEACSLPNRSWEDDLKVALPVVMTFSVSLVLTVVWYRHSHFHGKHEKKKWILDSDQLSFRRIKISSTRTALTLSLVVMLKREYNCT